MGLTPAEASPARLPELDGIRGLACLLVLVGHFFFDQIAPVPGTPLAYLHRCLVLSTTGVDLFFVLSGYLLGGILLDNRAAPNLLPVFYARRSARIFPVYFAWFGLYLVASRCLGPYEQYSWTFARPLPDWSYATYTQNFVMAWRNDPGPPWLGITWSLAVEEQFYLLLPALMLLAPARLLPWLLCGLVASAPALRFAVHAVAPDHPFAAYVLLPCRWDSLFVGVLGAWAVRQPGWANHRAAVYRTLKALFAVCLAGAVAAVRWWPLVEVPSVYVFWHTVVALGYLVVLLLASEWRPLSALFRFKPLVLLGTISYGTYLFHMGFAGLLYGYYRGSRPWLGDARDLPLTTSALGLTVLLAWVSYRYFESPVLAWGRRWKYARHVRSENLTPADGLSNFTAA